MHFMGFVTVWNVQILHRKISKTKKIAMNRKSLINSTINILPIYNILKLLIYSYSKKPQPYTVLLSMTQMMYV